MANTLDLNEMDRRLAERLIRKGLLSDKEWEKHLKGALVDVSEKGEPITTKFEAGLAGTASGRTGR